MQGRVCGGGEWSGWVGGLFEALPFPWVGQGPTLFEVGSAGRHSRSHLSWLQGMIALRRGATELTHEDYMEGILEVQAKKKANLQYYA